MFTKLFEVEEPGVPQAKWFGTLAMIGIPMGWFLMEFDFGHQNFIAIIPTAFGTICYLIFLPSIYFSSRRGKTERADERQRALYYRAGTYAFRGFAVTTLLSLLYAAIASQPERQWWLPNSPMEFAHLAIPLGLVTSILPAVVAEWLDPAATSDGEN